LGLNTDLSWAGVVAGMGLATIVAAAAVLVSFAARHPPSGAGRQQSPSPLPRFGAGD
jgi:hypothetical protein